MRVVIAGASGFLGTHLTEHLRVHGHEVTGLTRGQAKGPRESQWDPGSGQVDDDVIAGADAVVNLAGASIVGNPHSGRWAREVMSSRVDTTQTLAAAITRQERPPVFLAGNGISWYGDHGSTQVSEDADSRGDALLTRVSRAWEEATAPAHAAGARVCVLRTSPVMDRSAPPLRQLKLLFSLGLGTRLGSGEQYFPMISLRDWIGAVAFLLESQDVAGTFNLCCPVTPTNAEFTKSLAEALDRRAFLAAPAAVIKLAAGDMAPEVLNSVNARPAALERAGYDFQDEDVRDVLAAALG